MSKTLPEFLAASQQIGWNWEERLENFFMVLEGLPQTAWEEALANNPEFAAEDNGELRFRNATDLLLKKLLNNNTPCNQQWIYLAPGGDKSFLQDIMTNPLDHL